MARLLPPSPSRVLDVGAGTGFLSLIAARLGHEVTALDISPRMLGQLERRAVSEGLEINTLVGPAHLVPHGFDAVMERHLMWTLPDPARALRSWREAAPIGRLVLFESIWGTVDNTEWVRGRLRHLLRRMRGTPPEHHASYDERLRQSLPLGSGTSPERLVEIVADSGWRHLELRRLRDVEWSERLELDTLERLLGVPPRFAVSAS